jgi:hypothetical protein
VAGLIGVGGVATPAASRIKPTWLVVACCLPLPPLRPTPSPTKLSLRRPTTTTPPMAAPVSQPPVAARASSRFLAHGLGAVPESAPASLRFSVGRNRRAARLGPSGCSPLILVLGTEIISRGGWACGPVVKAHGRARAGGGSSPRPAPQGRGKNAVSLKKIISRASLSF